MSMSTHYCSPAKEKSLCPSDATDCSRFADTPETNAHIGSHAHSPDDTAMWLEIGLPRQFERERNEARQLCRDLWDLAAACATLQDMDTCKLFDSMPEWIHSENSVLSAR